MENPVIMSKEFQAAILHELHVVNGVIDNYDDGENIFEMDDLKRYRQELEWLYENWIITE